MDIAFTRVVVVSDTAKPPYAQDIACGRHTIVADETMQRGGLDSGPAPFALLLASLGACTAIALRTHCEKRAWPLERLMVTLGSRRTHIVRAIHILGSLTEPQLATLQAICERTPVTRLLKPGIRIKTELHVQRPA